MDDELAIDTKKLILSVVTSTPDSVSIMRLKKDFYDLIGSQIPFTNLGFETLELYLHSIRDTVVISGRGPSAMVKACFSEKSAHVDKLIANQKKNKPREPRRGGHFRPRTFHFNSSSIKRMATTFPRFFPPQPQYYSTSQYCSPQPLMNDRHGAFKTNYRPTPSTSGCNFNQTQRSQQYRPNDIPLPIYNTKSADKITRVSSPLPPSDKVPTLGSRAGNAKVNEAATSADIRSISPMKTALEKMSITPSRDVKLIPAGLESASDDTTESYDEGDEIYTDSEEDESVPSSSNVPTSHTPTFGKLGGTEHDPTGTREGLLNQTNFGYNIRVPKDVQENLITLITSEEANDGLWCGRLCDLYKERFGGSLNADRYGFPSLVAMCLELPGICHCIQVQRGDYKLFDSRKPYPKDIVKMNIFVRKLEHINTSTLSQSANNVPPLPENHMSTDYCVLNDQIPRLDLSSILSVHDDIDVRIAEVYDPSKFWLYIIGDEFSDKLNNMMDQIQSFYIDKNKFLIIPKENIQVGLLCCASYFKEFHRAIIIDTNLPKPNLVKVYFLDYGTVGKVQVSNVLYLHRQFAVLPQQAIRARLAGIYPPEAKTPWSRAAGLRFFDLVYERQLIAQIDRINDKRQEIDIFLTDTSSENDVHIPDKLVEEGYATFTHHEQTAVKLDWRFEPIVQYIHLYPTFQEIETGRVHTITEMCQLAELGVPYYVAYSHYFCHKNDSKSFADADYTKIPPDVVNDILEQKLSAPIDETATWVENIDNSNISDIVSIADIEAEPFRQVLIADCDNEKFLLIRFNNKVHLEVQQLLSYFKETDLTIIQIRRLCTHLGIKIPCLTMQFDKEIFKLLLGMEQLNFNCDALHLVPVEEVPIFYEKITGEVFSLNVWPNIEKLLSFSSDIWVK